MKVLVVGDRLTQSNGVANFIMNYYRNINPEKISFEFLVATDKVTNYQREIKDNGGKIYRLPSHTDDFMKFVKGYMNLLSEQNDIRIVHVHFSTGISIVYGLIARLYGKKVIYHAHGDSTTKSLKDRMLTPLLRIIGNYYAACSQSSGQYYFGKNIINNKKFKVLKNAFDLNKYSFNKLTRKIIRKEFNIEHKSVIGHTGRLVPVKNHEYILEVFKELCEDENQYVLILVGEGYLLPKIKEKAKELGIYQSIIFTESRSDVNELLQAMDIFIFPSVHEGLGSSLIEAQVSGLPCFASDSITREAEVTDNVKFLDINSDPSIWADEIKKTVKEHVRVDEKEIVKKAGYDIKYEAQKLRNLYEKL